MIVTLGEPIFDIINPDVGPKISDVMENGELYISGIYSVAT